MKIVINASTIYKGGAEQVAISFINECKGFPENRYYVLLRENISSQLNLNEFPKNFTFYHLEKRPGSGIVNLFNAIQWCKKIEKEVNPDCVISTGGHGYWRPKAPLLAGFNIPHYIYPESPYFDKMSTRRRLFWKLKKMAHFYFYRKADAFIVQTDDVNRRLQKQLPGKDIYTVSNTVNSYFRNPAFFENKLPEKEDGEVRMLTLSSYYPHKNIEIIRDVIDSFKNNNSDTKNYRFVLTLPDEIFKSIFEDRHRKQIYNVGFIPIKECPSLYNECDFMFLPTLLECFSASYAEAMMMGKPILTSNLGFAHTVCGDAALYFDPVDPDDILFKVDELIHDPEKQEKLIQNGKKRLNQFNTSTERASEFISICKNLASSGM